MTKKFYSILAAGALACAMPAFAQERFDTPEAAAQAVIEAAANHDSARLAAIIGPQSKAILTSGHPDQDRNEQSEFARQARAKHAIEVSPMNSNRAILSIGDDDWPFPVPLRCINGKWSFDASGAPTEMRARHIGADELDAIEICRGYVEAQRKFASEDRDGDGMLEYAPHLMSAPGRHDGLYSQGEADALIPAGLANSGTKPYHGYHFRILSAQGPDAPGGAHNYMVKDKMIGGFGLVAWPAQYGVTGIHTFIVNQDGAVYQKDIEPVQGKPLAVPALFDPGHAWQPVE